MAWIDSAIAILRVIINDSNSAAYTYSDCRLTDILMVGAMYTKQDIQFSTTYTIDIINKTISPDPSADEIFTNFVVMRSACVCDFSTFRTQALMEGVTARCGPATLSVLNRNKAFKDLLEVGPCASYQTMRQDYIYGGGLLCKAVMSPFIGNNFDPQTLNHYESFESRNNYIL
jgi:hypothetical protein